MGAPGLFPMFLKLIGRPCVVVGAGSVGEPKIASLLDAGANIRVVAPEATEKVQNWAREGRIGWEQRLFCDWDLDDCFLVIGATNNVQVNDRIYRQAEARGILCNIVDDPERCDFYYPAVVHRGPLQIAISTSGQSPALAQRLRRELEVQFGPEYGAWVEQLGRDREQVLKNSAIGVEQRRNMLHVQASAPAYQRFIANRPLRLETLEPKRGG